MTRFPVRDPETKWILTCRDEHGSGLVYKLLWRGIGEGSKPVPAVGARLRAPGGPTVIVERVEPPGTPVESEPGTGTLFFAR